MATSREPVELSPSEARAWRSHFDLARDLFVVIERRLTSAVGISVADYEMLEPLLDAGEEGLRPGQLATAAGWQSSRVAHQVRRMERRGLVRRRPYVADGRGTVVELTDAGRDAATRSRPILHATVRDLMIDAVDTPDLEAFATVCRAIRARIHAVEIP